MTNTTNKKDTCVRFAIFTHSKIIMTESYLFKDQNIHLPKFDIPVTLLLLHYPG